MRIIKLNIRYFYPFKMWNYSYANKHYSTEKNYKYSIKEIYSKLCCSSPFGIIFNYSSIFWLYKHNRYKRNDGTNPITLYYICG